MLPGEDKRLGHAPRRGLGQQGPYDTGSRLKTARQSKVKQELETEKRRWKLEKEKEEGAEAISGVGQAQHQT